MVIRKTRMDEMDTVLVLYAKARKFMAEHGNPNQWGDSYPEPDMIKGDILQGHSYVCEQDGRIVATFFYRTGVDQDYLEIHQGQWLDDSAYGVIHRITSDGTTKGAASFCLNWALEQCGNIKIDTHRDNLVMQKMLEKNGFHYCGIIYIKDGAERLAFQKKKDNFSAM